MTAYPFRPSRTSRRAEKREALRSLALAAANAGGPPFHDQTHDYGKTRPPAKSASGGHPGAKPTKPKRRRNKKSLFVRLRDALDKEAQSYAAKRDEEKGCRIRKAAQCTGRSEVGYHLIPRGKWSIRWDLDFQGIGNIVGACSPCNSGERWHRLDYAERHRELFGVEFYESLWDKANEPMKHTSTGMQKLLDEIRERRAALNPHQEGG